MEYISSYELEGTHFESSIVNVRGINERESAKKPVYIQRERERERERERQNARNMGMSWHMSVKGL
jgi:hypothetical protein